MILSKTIRDGRGNIQEYKQSCYNNNTYQLKKSDTNQQHRQNVNLQDVWEGKVNHVVHPS